MNILFPMNGHNRFADDQYAYPKPLIELGGETMVEAALRPYIKLTDTSISVALSKKDVNEHNLDEVLKRIAEPSNIQISILSGETAGSLCTSLLLAEQLESDGELLIVDYDQYIGFDINDVLLFFRSQEADFGVVSFESVHPKWSYVRLDDVGDVIEASEKKPISKNALAGIYYFKSSDFFKTAAKKTLLEASAEKLTFYVSDALNAYILLGKVGKQYRVPRTAYRKFYDANEVHDHISMLAADRTVGISTKRYVDGFNRRDLEIVSELLANDIILYDPNEGKITGKSAVLDFVAKLFDENPELRFIAKRIICEANRSVIEFTLHLSSVSIHGCDVIQWVDGKITNLHAYLEIK